MIKVNKIPTFVCNSCVAENAYRIACMPNEHNGCALYLCEDCLQKMIGQVALLKEAEDLKRERFGK